MLITHFGLEQKITQNIALTIGNFDGIHRGHQLILQRLSDEAKTRGLIRALMIFEPQPTEYFASLYQKEKPYRLTSLREKLILLDKTQCLDMVWVLRFNSRFADLSADDFIQKVLIDALRTKYLLIGDDFHFGKNRLGDVSLLMAENAFVTEQVSSVLAVGKRASSTAVRQHLVNGDIQAAEQILGHFYTISGRVKHGKKLARTLGMPTANIHLPMHRYPLNGVFVVDVEGAFGVRRGVANFGVNPTVSHDYKQKLEVHLFQFQGNLYGQRLRVHFRHKIRDEMQFDSLNDLRTQILQDMEVAKLW